MFFGHSYGLINVILTEVVYYMWWHSAIVITNVSLFLRDAQRSYMIYRQRQFICDS